MEKNRIYYMAGSGEVIPIIITKISAGQQVDQLFYKFYMPVIREWSTEIIRFGYKGIHETPAAAFAEVIIKATELYNQLPIQKLLAHEAALENIAELEQEY